MLPRRLETALKYRLTLLIAPAGYGKTATLRTWVDRLDYSVSWLTLGVGDNDPAQFLTNLIAALEGSQPDIAKVGGSHPEGMEASPADRMIDLINSLAGAPEDFILVLDNYHAIESPLVHALVELLLDHPPPRLHLVLATRSEPPLPLPRLRVRRQLLELAISDE